MRVASPLVFALVPAALVACNPNDCQGALTTDLNDDTVDVIEPVARCAGLNTVVTDDVTVTNQQQLDELLNCSEIQGNLLILGSTDIVDLAPLATLERVTRGYVLIQDNAALTNAELPVLIQVDYGFGVVDNPVLGAVAAPTMGIDGTNQGLAFGDITLRGNPELATLNFTGIQELRNDGRFEAAKPNPDFAGNLIIADNAKLVNLQGFANLERIEGFVSIFGNAAMTSLSGLDKVTEILNAGKAKQALSIGIDFNEKREIVAAGNAALVNLQGLNAVTTIGGDIVVAFNPVLNSLEGLGGITTHVGNIFIAGNNILPNLDGLQGVGDQTGLVTLNGSLFVGLLFDTFGGPLVAGNPQLANLNGLENLTTLQKDLVIAFNNQFEDFTGLDALPAIGGNLTIVGANQINNFNGALALTTITGSLFLGQLFGADNLVLAKVPTLDERDQLLAAQTTTSIQVDLTQADDGFEVLTNVGGDVVVAFSDLGTLDFSQQQLTIGGRLVLHGNQNPGDLTGIEDLNSLGGLVVGIAIDKVGGFSISENANFDAFTGLQLNALGGGGLAIGQQDVNLGTLPNFNNIAGSVTMVNLGNLNNLEGLDVNNIGGSLFVGAIKNGNDAPIDANNENLTSLTLQELGNVGGDILIAFNPDLSDVSMPALGNVGGAFEITASDSLDVITGMNAISNVGDLRLHDLVANQINLASLDTVDGDVLITRNENLDNLGLNQLVSVGNTLEISFNDALTDINTLANLNTVGNLGQGVGDLIVADNNALAAITGLNGLQTVGGSFFLIRCGDVNTLELNTLAQVGRSLEIAGMDNLQTLEGLGVNTIGDTFRVRANQNLTSFLGVEGLTNIGEKLSVLDNPVLETILIDSGNDNVVQAGDEGLVTLVQVGNDNLNGDRGVIEAQNNPQLDEGQVDDVVDSLNFDGFTILCGNQGSAVAQCGIVVAPDQGAGEGEGEGE